MYYPFVRKALFQLDPERAHEVTFQQLRRVSGTPLEMLVRQKVPAKPVTCMGLTFKNPLGLAAGLDKNGECIDALGAMGFGSIEIGTVTPRPQPGNDKPRIFRLVDAEGVINRLGFNNHGVDNLVENGKNAHFDGILGINIAMNKDTPVEQGKDDYLICMEKIYGRSIPFPQQIAHNTPPVCTPGIQESSCTTPSFVKPFFSSILSALMKLPFNNYAVSPGRRWKCWFARRYRPGLSPAWG